MQRAGSKILWQTLISDYPYKHQNRMRLDFIAEEVNKLALKISDKVEYQNAVDYILQLIADRTLPNTVERSNAEFDLFRLRYFWWAEHEFMDMKFDNPIIHKRYKYEELFTS